VKEKIIVYTPIIKDYLDLRVKEYHIEYTDTSRRGAILDRNHAQRFCCKLELDTKIFRWLKRNNEYWTIHVEDWSSG
jgi:hypothetical protein